jgi:hypothetical protein
MKAAPGLRQYGISRLSGDRNVEASFGLRAEGICIPRILSANGVNAQGKICRPLCPRCGCLSLPFAERIGQGLFFSKGDIPLEEIIRYQSPTAITEANLDSRARVQQARACSMPA